jgi:exodeoxyribonuclease VII small subunit
MTELQKENAAPPQLNSFEKTIEELQATVRQLESGELTLDDALKAFEKGVALARGAQSQLTAAEQKVEQLMQVQQDGTVETRPFTVANNPSDQSGGPRS